MRLRLFILLAFCGWGSGCVFDVETCSTDDDCPQGSECVLAQGDLVCLFPPNTMFDVEPVTDTGFNDPNNRNNINNQTDLGSDRANNTSTCEVPLVDSICRNDNFEPNNGPSQAERLPGSPGCDNFGEGFEPQNWSIDATLCALESEDWFGFTFSRCVIRKRMIVEVTPKRDCTGNEYLIEIPGFPCSDTERVSCERYPDGVRRTVVLLNKTGDFGPDIDDVEVGIVEASEDAEFEYRLTIQVSD